jgi:hypothetical protein
MRCASWSASSDMEDSERRRWRGLGANVSTRVSLNDLSAEPVSSLRLLATGNATAVAPEEGWSWVCPPAGLMADRDRGSAIAATRSKLSVAKAFVSFTHR